MMDKIEWQQGRGGEFADTPVGRFTIRPVMSRAGVYAKWNVWGPSATGGPDAVATSLDAAREVAERRIWEAIKRRRA